MIDLANNTTNSSSIVMPNVPDTLLSIDIQNYDHVTASIANKDFEKYS